MNAIRIAAIVAVGLALPWILPDYDLRVMVLALQTAIAVIGLGIAFGWCGLIQLAQASYVGVGAYTSALLAVHFGINFWLATPIAMAVAGLVALVFAGPMLRLRGHYLALATVGFSVTCDIIMKNWVGLTGGFDGISGVPGVFIGSHELVQDWESYYLALGFLAAVTLFAAALRASPFGRSMIALRDDELAGGTAGVSVVRMKILAFVIASALAGLSGSLFVHYSNYAAPQDFDLVHSIVLLVMLIVGGEASVTGAIIGAILLSFLPEMLRFLGQGYLAFFGAGVLLCLILMPQGVAGLIAQLRGGDMPDAILSVQGLTCRFGGLTAVDDAHFSVERGRILALIGPNGAGKSTTVNLLTGVQPPTAGTILLEGQDIVGLAPHRIVQRGLVRTFQNGRLFPRLNVLENVLVGGENGRKAGFADAVFRTRRFRGEDRQQREAAQERLRELGLTDMLNRMPGELPYGKQRKLEIARALMAGPKVLLLDEPAAGLNSGEVEELIAFVSGLRETGLSILLIEHNMGLVMRLADHITVLNFGRIIASGPPKAVRNDPAVIEAYLGRSASRVAD